MMIEKETMIEKESVMEKEAIEEKMRTYGIPSRNCSIWHLVMKITVHYGEFP